MLSDYGYTIIKAWWCTHSTWKRVYTGMSIPKDTGSTSAYYTIWECCGCGVTEERVG